MAIAAPLEGAEQRFGDVFAGEVLNSELIAYDISKLVSGDFCRISTLTSYFVAIAVVLPAVDYDVAATLEWVAVPTPGIFLRYGRGLGIPAALGGRDAREFVWVETPE